MLYILYYFANGFNKAVTRYKLASKQVIASRCMCKMLAESHLTATNHVEPSSVISVTCHVAGCDVKELKKQLWSTGVRLEARRDLP